ncbi:MULTISPECIES: tautomerase family protein [unclassified Aureimonas]|uniref:tautomerase family protein n=1 Tax=unclassified Aureimonas TaxID=2615206 RepID=UPI0006FCDAE0|nr:MULTISPECIES: tautomerase family protein [unclassified Aureimonas]KQT69620.1 4-oxalocrotonate tautomerase [Aureimonas sp. Leaf427]KQT80971.1 4-oxalocrotonate tautomerase [Aureimonas sp. Leaf460]
MPFVHIRVAGAALPSEKIETLQRAATRLMADLMHKKADLTAVLIEQQAEGSWSVGGHVVPSAAHLDVQVTAGTNSPDEKTAFIREAHALLSDTIGSSLPLATYVVVQEIAADAWGYGGQTQAARSSKPS